MDSSKAKEKLGWTTEVALDQMIAHDLSQAKQYALLKQHGYSEVVGKEN